jgi:hypothetical protein
MNSCNLCDGPLVELGTLGILTWYRCRNCGMEFSARAEPPEIDHEDIPSPSSRLTLEEKLDLLKEQEEHDG